MPGGDWPHLHNATTWVAWPWVQTGGGLFVLCENQFSHVIWDVSVMYHRGGGFLGKPADFFIKGIPIIYARDILYWDWAEILLGQLQQFLMPPP